MNIIKTIKSKIKSALGKDVLFPENRDLISMFKAYSKSYILGTSPSINQIDLNKLDSDALVISMGNFHEHPDIDVINPHIHVFAASHPPITENVFRNWFSRAEEVLPNNTIVLVENRDFALAKSIFTSRQVYAYAYGGEFPIDFTKKIKSPLSVSQVAMQLAVYVKSKKVFFLGIDLHWQLLDPYHHFYAHDQPSLEYYLKQDGISISYGEKRDLSKNTLYYVYKVYKSYEDINNYALISGSNIVNGNLDSKFDVFPYEKCL